MRVKRAGGRARPSSMASANPRPVSLLALKEGCDGDGGVNNHSPESGSIEQQSDGVDCHECDAVNVIVTPDSGVERVCDDAEKSPSRNECESGGESCAGVENTNGKIFDVDGNERDRVNVTLDSGGERVCGDAKKLPSGNPDDGERVRANAKKLPSGNPDDGGERVCADAKKLYGDISVGDAMEIDSLEEETCIKCNGGGEVLLCSEMGCPVALHENCLGSEPLFDDAGKFYCPYCFYKRAIARARELKGKAMEAKKELSSFLYPKVVGGDKGEGKGKQSNAERAGTSVLHGNGNHLDHDNVWDNDIVENLFGKGTEDCQAEGKENIANRDQKHVSPYEARDGDTICHGQEETIKGIEDLRDNLEREKQCEDETSTTHQFEVGTVQEEELGEHEHGPYEGIGGDRQQAETYNACHTNDETNVDNSLNTSTKQANNSVKVSEEIPRRNKEQGTVQIEELREYEHGERRAKQRTRNSGNPYSFDSPSKLAARLKDVNDTARSQMVNLFTSKVESIYYVEKSCKDRMERDAATNKSRRQQESTRQAPIFFNGKRKRLLWTAEEEEMIKKGVNIMSSTVSIKIPWRKILESGSHVFHPSRNPSDLKDKWKTLRKVSK